LLSLHTFDIKKIKVSVNDTINTEINQLSLCRPLRKQDDKICIKDE
ncbi:MAG: hypothetical protein ACI90V_007153, partial [Bacillariaceae sp.]